MKTTTNFEEYEPGKNKISDEDIDLILAYAENRLDKKQMFIIKKRINKEPALFEALTDLIINARESKYETQLYKSSEKAGVSSFDVITWSSFLFFLKKTPDILNQYLSPFGMPKTVSLMTSACLVILIAYGIYYRTDISSDMPVPVSIRIIASKNKIPGNDVRTGISTQEFELKPGDELLSGSYFKIYLEAEENSFVSIWFHDSSGEIIQLHTDKIDAGKVLIISDGDDGYQLDENAGTEIIYLLSSKYPVSDAEQKIKIFKKEGITEFKNKFPELSIQTFRFEHK
ncbi:Uncharacterized protein dnl_10320 [Desulfonema limicola]|uniref:DUF4384 domain-containing protein n=2 Tax=Desulfonema limicola TaxID=45656 RepID=A0A975GF44_9BACT|nr:Uncharacterized protein dnl_10320 [Desulfonema limicola]